MHTKAQFHIGDRVCVILAGKYVPFTITGISDSPTGTLYCGDNQPWTPEDRLDYTLSPEQEDYIKVVERRVEAAVVSMLDLNGLGQEPGFKQLPASMRNAILCRIGMLLAG